MAKTKNDVEKMGRKEKEDLMKLLAESLGVAGESIQSNPTKKNLMFASPSGATPTRMGNEGRKRKNGSDEIMDQGGKRPRQMSTTHDEGYRVEKVFLSGISEPIRKNGITFGKAILKAMPDIKIKDIHFTRSGAVILLPATPLDCNKLLKEDWSKHSFLGSNVQASVDKNKKIEYKAVVTQVDPDLDDEEVKEEIEARNDLKVTEYIRFLNKETKAKTYKILISLENEDKQRQVLTNGVYIGLKVHLTKGKVKTQAIPPASVLNAKNGIQTIVALIVRVSEHAFGVQLITSTVTVLIFRKGIDQKQSAQTAKRLILHGLRTALPLPLHHINPIKRPPPEWLPPHLSLRQI